MPFIDSFDPTTLKSLLRVSNYWAKANRNQYPVAFSNLLNAIYEWVPCPCNDRCSCKNFNCTHHYVRKSGISFDIVQKHFFSCYVDKKMRESIEAGKKTGRGKYAYEASNSFKTSWGEFPPLTTNLLCTEWCNKEFQEYAESFKAEADTIYKAKWLSILQLDTFVAYDTASIRLMKREYKGHTYYDLVSAIRADLIKHLTTNSTDILSFRQYDNPNEHFSEIPIEQYRPIGNIIDKLFLTL